jgi:hypothetical protein
MMITYFILQTVGAPDSTILSDAKKMTSTTMDGMMNQGGYAAAAPMNAEVPF